MSARTAGMASPAAAVASAVVPGLSAQVDIAYSLNESAASTPNRPTTYSTDDPDDDEDERGERLLPSNRPRRSSFDVALHEDPLFHTTHPCTKKLRHAFKKSWGLVLMLISSAMLSTSTLIVSLLSPSFTTWELSAWRLLGQWLCTLVFFQYTKKSLRFEQAAMKAMVLRCFAGLGSMLFLYMAVKHMAMANATVIRYTSPVMVAVMAKIVRPQGVPGLGGAASEADAALRSWSCAWVCSPPVGSLPPPSGLPATPTPHRAAGVG